VHGGKMKASRTNQAGSCGLISFCVESQSSNNNANQLDLFFIRAAHEKGSSYLRRYASDKYIRLWKEY